MQLDSQVHGLHFKVKFSELGGKSITKGEPINTVVATSTCSSVKPAISPSNIAQNTNPGTVLDSARPEDSKTPPTC